MRLAARVLSSVISEYKFMIKFLLGVIVCLNVWTNVHAQSPFYQNKTVTIVVGYLAGDGYDIWARLLAAHMGKHIPGNPNFMVVNTPGAGSMIAANSRSVSANRGSLL